MNQAKPAHALITTLYRRGEDDDGEREAVGPALGGSPADPTTATTDPTTEREAVGPALGAGPADPTTATADPTTEREEADDPFAARGLGPDVYGYRTPYAQFLNADGSLAAAAPPAGELAARYAAAARAIAAADFLLVGAGAGMGVDAGLAAYADVADVPQWAARGHDYGSLCRPALLDEVRNDAAHK